LNALAVSTSKPPYHVPTMEEIRALPWNGYSAISTFSGAGGSSLGYRMAGFKVLWASEFVEAARETYNANKAPHTVVDARDIRQVSADDVLAAIAMAPGELDLMDGSPPCASFSTSGKLEAGWGKVNKYSDTAQRTDDLFFEFSRLLRGIQPKVFVAENVSGLVKGTAKGYFKRILSELKLCGYRVSCRVLDAQWLGVPQSRRRTIFIGVREDLGIEPAHPKPLPYRYTVRDALPWILRHGTAPGHALFVASGKSVDATMVDSSKAACPTITTTRNKGTGYIEARITRKGHGYFPGGEMDLGRPAPTVPATKGGAGYYSHEITGGGLPPDLDRRPPVEVSADISRYAIGAEWDKLKPGEQSKKYFSLQKPRLDKPSPCITQTAGITSAAGVVHPTERRKFSIGELKRICAFPDDFRLTGTYAQQWERLGRAVPPVMMAHIAATIRDEILAKCVD